MARLITQVMINAYRGIQDLQLENLNHINIIAGDNNTGKTSIMEILSLMENPSQIGTWANAIRRNINVKPLFYNIFYNMFPIDREEKIVSFSYCEEGQIDKEYKKIDLQAVIEKTQVLEKEKMRLNGFIRTGATKNAENEMVDTNCMHLIFAKNGQIINTSDIYDFQSRISMFRNIRCEIPVVSVLPTSHVTGMLYMQEVLENAELYQEMLEVLREFDENIISINAVYPSNAMGMEYAILSKNHRSALPLSVYGDGMKKAILLLSAVVKAKGGILLLDEFETAIHTSAMDQVFSWILKTAKKLNVQVFLTSHSKEAIDKAMKCCPELQEDINVYTLYKQEDKNFVRCMSCKEAIHAKDSLGLELR